MDLHVLCCFLNYIHTPNDSRNIFCYTTHVHHIPIIFGHKVLDPYRVFPAHEPRDKRRIEKPKFESPRPPPKRTESSNRARGGIADGQNETWADNQVGRKYGLSQDTESSWRSCGGRRTSLHLPHIRLLASYASTPSRP